MHNDAQLKRRKLNYYARILIAISLAFLIYGFFLQVSNHRNFASHEIVTSVKYDTHTIIDINNSLVYQGEVVSDGVKLVDSPITEGSSNGNPYSDSSKSSTKKPVSPDETESHISKQKEEYNIPTSPSSSSSSQLSTNDPNNSLRLSIQNSYGVTIKYGSETEGYQVGGLSTISLVDSNVIQENLNRLKNAMSLYPDGFWKEIKNGGIPLTIYLIDRYSTYGVTGVTDSNYNRAIISIAVQYGFEESFYHESYHYIERYMMKKRYNYTTWTSYNPMDFSYGTINSDRSYNRTFSQDVYFVNDYAQTSEAEDRASTFEYMMDTSKASCLNKGKPVWRKASQMSIAIDAVMNSVSPSAVEYWERFL